MYREGGANDVEDKRGTSRFLEDVRSDVNGFGAEILNSASENCFRRRLHAISTYVSFLILENLNLDLSNVAEEKQKLFGRGNENIDEGLDLVYGLGDP